MRDGQRLCKACPPDLSAGALFQELMCFHSDSVTHANPCQPTRPRGCPVNSAETASIYVGPRAVFGIQGSLQDKGNHVLAADFSLFLVYYVSGIF